MLFVELVLLGLAVVGHVIFWVALVNRIHSTGVPHWAIAALSAVCWFMLLAIPLTAAAAHSAAIVDLRPVSGTGGFLLFYLGGSWLVVLLAAGNRVVDNRRSDQPHVLLANHCRSIDLVDVLGHRPVGDRSTGFLTRLPGNEVLELCIQHKTLRIPRLHPALEGLTFAHLSDLHLSGRIEKAYFQEVFRLTNEMEVDVVAITGDLFDAASCIDWGLELFGQLQSRYGVYFVLGNHDRHVDCRHVRGLLSECGLVDLGGRWQEIVIDSQPVILAGNELPWFSPAADMEHCPTRNDERSQLRVLLSHSPDQFLWAERYDFDLMLAGHTHGGQIRLPLLGPIVSPSRVGTKYAAGTFAGDPTILHVSRGISSLTPLRWNCPPELAILELRSASQ